MEAIDNQHGGDIYAVAEQLGVDEKEIVDLSSNIAPPNFESIKKLVIQFSSSIHVLPEPYCKTLIERLSKKYQIDPNYLLIGAGTTELFNVLCQNFANQTATLIEPSYSDYRKYLSLHQIKPLIYWLSEKNDFNIIKDDFTALIAQSNLVLLGNPNNPTGTLIEKSRLINWIEKYPNAVFIIDESYMPFVSTQNEPLNHSLVNEMYPNLVVLRSFSKIFSLPGARVGWMVSQNTKMLNKLKTQMSPWSVNSIGQKICEQLIDVDTWANQKLVKNNKKHFLKQINSLKWLKPYSSQANFVLFKLDNCSAYQVYEHCLKDKILIRDCSNFEGLDSTFIRISIKDTASMDKVVKTLIKFKADND